MNLYDRIVERIARTPKGAAFFARVATQVDRVVMKWSGGRITSGIGSRFGGNIALVVMRGAKTGIERTTPLLGTADGERLVLVASYAGHEKNPAWYGNLKKTPQCRALFRGKWRDYEAHEAQGDERERMWALAVAGYPGYAEYQKRIERRIPVMVLEPKA
jgi:deazaflavin-dependent oxidoreductase (nitroreductase family)